MFGRYLQFLDVVPEDSLLYVAHHNPALVGLSIVIAVFAAFTSLLVARYAERTDDGRDEAMTMVGDREKVIEAGMDDHIAKPLDVDAMLVTLAKWIKPAASATVQDTPAALAEALPALVRLGGGAATVSAISSFAPPAPTAGVAAAPDLGSRLTRLRELIANGDAEAMDVLADLERLAAGTPLAVALAATAAAIADYDFDGAMDTMDGAMVQAP